MAQINTRAQDAWSIGHALERTRASELGLERSRCTRHSALDRAPLSASGARGELAAAKRGIPCIVDLGLHTSFEFHVTGTFWSPCAGQGRIDT
eukprot:1138030-Pelagomonas_calceolata.AAC.4